MSTASLIKHAQDLINHPRTGAEERDAAQRLLDRLLKRIRIVVAETGAYNPYAISYGPKYTHGRYVPLDEIAKMMRADISAARKLGKKAAKATPTAGAVEIPDPIGNAPAEIRITVKFQYYSGGGAIDIYVRNVPTDWGFTTETDRWGHERQAPTQALKDLADALREIHWSYNYDGSDAQTDYFNRNYYGGVMTPEGTML